MYTHKPNLSFFVFLIDYPLDLLIVLMDVVLPFFLGELFLIPEKLDPCFSVFLHLFKTRSVVDVALIVALLVSLHFLPQKLVFVLFHYFRLRFGLGGLAVSCAPKDIFFRYPQLQFLPNFDRWSFLLFLRATAPKDATYNNSYSSESL
jgi:hypothetical protein